MLPTGTLANKSFVNYNLGILKIDLLYVWAEIPLRYLNSTVPY